MSATTTRTIRSTFAIALAAALLGVGGAAQARPDAGAPVTEDPTPHCGLARVGTQYVSCDNLTGNDVPAPLWIPQR